jgi:hypothetical protein
MQSSHPEKVQPPNAVPVIIVALYFSDAPEQ